MKLRIFQQTVIVVVFYMNMKDLHILWNSTCDSGESRVIEWNWISGFISLCHFDPLQNFFMKSTDLWVTFLWIYLARFTRRGYIFLISNHTWSHKTVLQNHPAQIMVAEINTLPCTSPLDFTPPKDQTVVGFFLKINNIGWELLPWQASAASGKWQIHNGCCTQIVRNSEQWRPLCQQLNGFLVFPFGHNIELSSLSCNFSSQ